MALLDGLVVVDLSRVLAGPFAARVLAELGAEVIKVESPDGDPARAIGPHQDGRSLYFATFNSGKRGVVLDLRDPADRARLDRLLDRADVVVENFRPRAAAELGLTPERLLTDHPQLVVVTVSGYARDSDRAEEGAFDVAVQAEAGIMALTGEPDGPPVRAGVPISDLAAGLWAALGAVAGVLARQRTGRGCHLEVPLLDATLPLLSYVATAALHTGVEPPPVGSGHHELVPYRAYRAADGWVVIAVLSDKFWPPLCAALDLDDLAARADLRTVVGRRAARREIDTRIEQAVAPLRVAELVERLRTAGVPHAPVRSVLDALSTPYVEGRGLVERIATAEGDYAVVRGPLPGVRPLGPAPALGADQHLLDQPAVPPHPPAADR